MSFFLPNTRKSFRITKIVQCVLLWALLCTLCTFAIGQGTVPKVLQPAGTSSVKGKQKLICQDTIALIGNSPQAGETGAWTTFLPNQIQFLSPDSTNDTVLVRVLTKGQILLFWGIYDVNGDPTDDPAPVYLNNQSPSPANAGRDTIICRSMYALSALKPLIGNGSWHALSPGNLTFSNANAPNATVSNLQKGENWAVWQVKSDSSKCTNLPKDTIIIKNLSPSSVSIGAGFDTTVCAHTVKLHADPLTTGNLGKWIIPASVTISDPHDPRAVANNLKAGANTFVWSTYVDSAYCVSYDTVSITASQPQMALIFGKSYVDTTLCTSQLNLSGNSPISGSGNWTLAKGSGTFTNKPITLISNLGQGVDSLTWTIQNANCGSSTASIRITNNAATHPLVTKDSCFFGPFSPTLTVSIKNTLHPGEKGRWSIRKAPAPFGTLNLTNDTIQHRASFTTQGAGLYTFLYQVTNTNCSSSDSSQYHLTRKALLPNDTCLFVTQASPTFPVFIKARRGPKMPQGERGSWQRISTNTPAPTLTTTDSTLAFTGQTGVYAFTFAISNGNCSTKDTIVVTISNRAKILSIDSTCFKSAPHALKATSLSNGESGSWSSQNGVNFINAASINTTAFFPIGKSKIYWKVSHLNGCVSNDSITASRLTTPNAGPDRCEPFFPNSKDPLALAFKDSIIGNAFAANESGYWWNDPSLIAYTKGGNKLNIVSQTSGGSYKIAWTINTPECQTGFSDTAVLRFVTQPTAIKDTFFIVPFSIKPTLKGSSSAGVGEQVRWIDAPDTLKTPNLIVPDTNAGTYTYQYQIYNKNCAFSTPVKVTLVTNPSIASQYCLRNQANTTVSAKYFVKSGTGDTSIWSIDTTKYKVTVSIIPNNNANQLNINFYDTQNQRIVNGRFLIRHYVKSGTIIVKDSMYLTNLTKPIAFATYCSADTFVNLQAPPQFPVLQPYEKALRIKKSPSDPGKFKNGGTLTDVLYGVTPGQQQLAIVIRDTLSGCADTSAYSVLTTVTKAHAFDSPYVCIQDTFATIKAVSVPGTGEKGKWTYVSSYFPQKAQFNIQNDTLPTAKVTGLTRRNTKLAWTISNKNAPTCFSVDSLHSTIVVQDIARVGYLDTCIIGSTTVSLRAVPPPSYVKGAWTKLGTTTPISTSPITSYINAPLGTNTFIWTTFDSTYTACQSWDTLKAHVLNKATVLSSPTCLKKSSGQSPKDTLITKKDSTVAGLSHAWIKDNTFLTDSIALLDSSKTTYRFLIAFASTGKRAITWHAQASPSCYHDTSIQITVIPKAVATVSGTCIVSPNSVDTLKGNPTLANGEQGRWQSFLHPSNIEDSTKATTAAQLLSKGKTGFIWKISNGNCTDMDTAYSILLSKAGIGQDTCLYYKIGSKISIQNLPIASFEISKWKSQPSLQFDSLGSTLTNVSGFAKGPNVLTWKVSFETCSDSATVTVTTFTPSGFTGHDTLHICNKNVLVSASVPDTTLGESVSWSIKPSDAKISTVRSNGVDLSNIGNDGMYTLYRSIGKQSIGQHHGCPLLDSIKIENRQLDTLYVNPSGLESTGEPKTYYTCESFARVFTPNPSKDIPTATGSWTFSQPQGNIGGDKFVIKGESISGIDSIFSASPIQAEGFYHLVRTIRNKTYCPALIDSVIIQKKTGIANPKPYFPDTVCEDSYNFKDFPTYSLSSGKPEKGVWGPAGSFSIAGDSLVGSNVTATNLQYGPNYLTFTAYKGGCKGVSNITITRNSSFYDVIVSGDSVIYTCNKNQDTLLARHTLVAPNPDIFKVYWSNTREGKDTLNLDSLLTRNDTIQVVATNMVPNSIRKLYVFAQNGSKCPIKRDSVIIYNFKNLESDSVSVGLDQVFCDTSKTVFGLKPFHSQGLWTTNAPQASFVNDTAGITLLHGLVPSDTAYRVYWSVRNGVCSKTVSFSIRVGEPISTARLQMKRHDVCDSSLIQLQASAPTSGHGKWTLDGIFLDSNATYSFPVPPSITDSAFKFVWIVYNSLCTNTDTINIQYYKASSPAVAGSNQSVVSNSTTLDATPPAVGTGIWSVQKGTAIIADPQNPKTEVQNLNFGENTFLWSVSNGGCRSTSQMVSISFSDFSIPQGFSPNGDLKNDKFEIKGLENYSGTELKVFNRWGREVYASSNYQNMWDGDGLEDDTYYYVMTLVNGRKYHGYVIIKRK